MIEGGEMNIVLFDGLCNFCNSAVWFIIKRDRQERFKFAAIQSDVGQSYLKQYNIQSKRIDSIVYIKDNRCVIRSTAVLNILKDLGGLWTLSYVFIFVPRFFRDFVYNTVAKSRFMIFGKKDSCLSPKHFI